jgi:hypothetical protein
LSKDCLWHPLAAPKGGGPITSRKIGRQADWANSLGMVSSQLSAQKEKSPITLLLSRGLPGHFLICRPCRPTSIRRTLSRPVYRHSCSALLSPFAKKRFRLCDRGYSPLSRCVESRNYIGRAIQEIPYKNKFFALCLPALPKK